MFLLENQLFVSSPLHPVPSWNVQVNHFELAGKISQSHGGVSNTLAYKKTSGHFKVSIKMEKKVDGNDFECSLVLVWS